MAEDVVVVMVTCPTMEDASRIAKNVVENRKAACVNILPQLRSIYIWEGDLHDEPEYLLLMKTTPEMFEALSSAVREQHPYTVPEIVALPVSDGYDGYLRWVTGQVGSVEEPQ